MRLDARMGAGLLALLLLVASAAGTARAQATEGDTTATVGAPAAPATPAGPRGRLSWTSDRLPLKVGDLVTVVVDEQAAARERVTRTATGDRNMKASLLGHIDTGGTGAPSRYDVGFNTGYGTGSKDLGDAQRSGDLTAVLTVRVTGFESEGIARIEGHKQVNVDGRAQDVMLKGLIRSQDVGAGNTVRSERIADAVITYKGKKMAPNGSFVSKLFGMVWP
jgi:flagellar L-ring protein FlgH